MPNMNQIHHLVGFVDKMRKAFALQKLLPFFSTKVIGYKSQFFPLIVVPIEKIKKWQLLSLKVCIFNIILKLCSSKMAVVIRLVK